MNAPCDPNSDSLDLVEEVAELGSATPRVIVDNSRRHRRYSFRGRARAIVFPIDPARGEEPAETEVVTTDLSRGGLSLLYRKELFPGQQVLLMLSEASRLVEVRWCCRVWAGLYAAGCAFVGLPAEEQAADEELAE